MLNRVFGWHVNVNVPRHRAIPLAARDTSQWICHCCPHSYLRLYLHRNNQLQVCLHSHFPLSGIPTNMETCWIGAVTQFQKVELMNIEVLARFSYSAIVGLLGDQSCVWNYVLQTIQLKLFVVVWLWWRWCCCQWRTHPSRVPWRSRP